MYFTVYKTTNKINRKIYIGCHRTKKLNDNYLGSGTLLNRAIKKYGKCNFEKEILYIFDNSAEMYEKEIELVNEEFILLDSNYNMRIGGWGGKINDKIKEKISKKLTGRKLSDETKQKMSDRMTGTTLSEETKNKISESMKNKIPNDKTRKKLSTSAKKRAKNNPSSVGKGTIWINDGISIDRRVPSDTILPEGWKRGRLKGDFRVKPLPTDSAQ